MLRELAVLPTGKPLPSADPKGAISGGEEGSNVAAEKLLTGRRVPWHVPDAIETQQAKLRAEPKIAVGCLCDGCDHPFRGTLANPPCRVRVLADVERWGQRERTGGPCEHHADQHQPPHTAHSRTGAAPPAESNVVRRLDRAG